MQMNVAEKVCRYLANILRVESVQDENVIVFETRLCEFLLSEKSKYNEKEFIEFESNSNFDLIGDSLKLAEIHSVVFNTKPFVRIDNNHVAIKEVGKEWRVI